MIELSFKTKRDFDNWVKALYDFGSNHCVEPVVIKLDGNDLYDRYMVCIVYHAWTEEGAYAVTCLARIVAIVYREGEQK
ncbi:MAG: hypothetical protein DRJ40_07290 [Thermoprotei archaeon]|nr:MAG: hypothetical protein DRJ40_07290 [Thermoprotei archaeon]